MKVKKFAAVMCAAAMGFATACSGSGDAAKDAGGDSIRVWFMEGSISEAAQQYLVDTFAKENPGKTLNIEVQQWNGIVSKLQTSLASSNESPDLVEIGNTQTTSFTSVGAFAPLDDIKGDVGGDKLIPSFIDASTVDGKLYALPLYAGARGVFYRKDLLEQVGVAEPKSIAEFQDAMVKLQQANPEGKDGFSGMYLAAVDPHGVESMLFSDGFRYAEKQGDKWVPQVTTPESIKALKNLQRVFQEGTTFGQDTQASQKNFERLFNDGTVGAMVATGNKGAKIDQALWDGDKVGVMAIPGEKAGEVGTTFAGGSNIALATNSKNPELAKAALKVIFSEGFQNLIAKDGWVPGNLEYSVGDEGPFKDIATTIVEHSMLTPNTPQWGVAVGDNKVNDFFTRIAKGDDVEATAKQFNDDLETILNAEQ